ncbi:MAG: ABC transporter substrate-binding protein, partial [Syntrophobacter sp.]
MTTAAKITGVILLVLSMLGDCRAAEGTKYATFVSHWTPQAQFAGYYVALEKGFYKANNLEVNLLRGGPDRPSAEWLRKGAADFATMFLSTAILERAKGNKLINIGQLVTRSSQVLIAKKSSGIYSWRDMNGKKACLWGAELSIMPTALFRRLGLHVTVVPQAATVNLFLRGGVDLVSAMWYNEYHSIVSAGVEPEELTVIRLANVGFNIPEDGIYCLESTFKKDPRACCRFVRASLEGWRYAFDHREEALDIVMRYVREANVATNRQHQGWMLDQMREIIDLPESGGYPVPLKEDDFISVASELMSSRIIDEIPDFADFIRNCATVHEK